MEVLTQDSSFTQFSKEFGESYHSTSDGALKETLHKHILPSFMFCKERKKLKVLDICFGLGFNTLCFVDFLKKENYKGKVEVHSPELNKALIQSLSNHKYPKNFDLEILDSLIATNFYKKDNLEIFLHIGDARAILPTLKGDFDIVFQDAFSPLKNPFLWTFEYFKTLYKLSKKDCIITTYSQNSSMLYSAFLCGFKSFLVKQKEVRDSVIFLKTQEMPKIECINILEIKAIDILHKIKTNENLKMLSDSKPFSA